MELYLKNKLQSSKLYFLKYIFDDDDGYNDDDEDREHSLKSKTLVQNLLVVFS